MLRLSYHFTYYLCLTSSGRYLKGRQAVGPLDATTAPAYSQRSVLGGQPSYLSVAQSLEIQKSEWEKGTELNSTAVSYKDIGMLMHRKKMETLPLSNAKPPSHDTIVKFQKAFLPERSTASAKTAARGDNVVDIAGAVIHAAGMNVLLEGVALGLFINLDDTTIYSFLSPW